MFFNIVKYKVLHFGTNNAKYDYMLGDQVFDSVSIVLIVLIQDKLKVSEQCAKVVMTCNNIQVMI